VVSDAAPVAEGVQRDAAAFAGQVGEQVAAELRALAANV